MIRGAFERFGVGNGTVQVGQQGEYPRPHHQGYAFVVGVGRFSARARQK